MKLAPGQFFGQTLRQWRAGGLTVNVSRYQPGRGQPFHVHTHPTVFVSILGDKRDQTRKGAHEMHDWSIVFHPTNEPHASDVGPRGVLGLNLEFAPEWLGRHQLSETDLGGYQLRTASVWSRLAVLRLVCLTVRLTAGIEQDLLDQALELVEPLVKRGAASLGADPAWLRRGEVFLHDQFRSPVSLRDAAREAGVHPVYFARVFRGRHGCPVSAYLRALRLAEAGRLVLGRRRSLAESALEAGFADQAHLTRCFTRQFRFGPLALRVARDSLRP
jgi:AraC family transcriptional regulator